VVFPCPSCPFPIRELQTKLENPLGAIHIFPHHGSNKYPTSLIRQAQILLLVRQDIVTRQSGW